MPARVLAIAAYSAVVSISSAVLLVLEIVAARLIAPYVGVSLYTWSAVIGVILAGLSLGNWLGGVWADRGAGERAAGLTLIGAAAASLSVLMLLTWVAPAVQASELSLMGASLVLVMSLFFLPAVFIGVVTPLLTTLALHRSSRTGHIVGLMHALAAVGSILGTFAAGWWLIQAFGSRLVVIGCAATLFLLGLPLLGRRRVLPIGLAALTLGTVLSAATAVREGFADPCDTESAYFCIRVVDEDLPGGLGEARSLILDHLLHSTNVRAAPHLLLAPYVHLMDELIRRHHAGREDLRLFFVGGGAYTQPRAFRATMPAAQVTVAELDPAVTAVARERLYVDLADVDVHHTDARVLLARLHARRFEVIVADAFHDIAVPYHLVTREFAELVRARLTPDGLYVMNVVDAFPDGKLAKALVKTLRTVFPDVQVWLDAIPTEPMRVTYVLVAGDLDPMQPVLSASHGMPRRWYRVTAPLLETGTPLSLLPVLTDDHAPVEQLMASLFLTRLGR